MSYYNNPYRRLVDLGMRGWQRRFEEGGPVTTEGDSGGSASESSGNLKPLTLSEFNQALHKMAFRHPDMPMSELYRAMVEIGKRRGVIDDGTFSSFVNFPLYEALYEQNGSRGAAVAAEYPKNINEDTIRKYIEGAYSEGPYDNSVLAQRRLDAAKEDLSIKSSSTAIHKPIEKAVQDLAALQEWRDYYDFIEDTERNLSSRKSVSY